MNDKQMPAFPNNPNTCDEGRGMTLRDYFAAKAMLGFFSAKENLELSHKERAEFAYNQADAMMKARAL